MLKKIILTVAKVVIGLAIILVVVQLFLMRGVKPQPITRTNPTVSYSSTPTLLIPGWGGNTWTYGGMIRYFQAHNVAENALVVRVAPTGQVQVSGQLAKNQPNPLIEVLYDWNYTLTYEPQVHQLTHVLEVLNHRYGVKRINVLAHSYGGTEFLHAYIGSPKLQREIRVKRMIFLGVPVDESFGTNTRYTAWLFKHSHDEAFEKLEREVKEAHLPRTLRIYNWMGSDQGARTDGSVPRVQSQMLRTLVKEKHVHYHERVYQNTTHPQLHQRVAIFKDIQRVLWGKGGSDVHN